MKFTAEHAAFRVTICRFIDERIESGWTSPTCLPAFLELDTTRASSPRTGHGSPNL